MSRKMTWRRALLALLIFGAMFYGYILFIAPKTYVSSAHLQFVTTGTNAALASANKTQEPVTRANRKDIRIGDAVALAVKREDVALRLENGGFRSFPDAKTPAELDRSLSQHLYWNLAKRGPPFIFNLEIRCADADESQWLVNAIIDGFRTICEADGQVEVRVVIKPSRGAVDRRIGLFGY